MQVELQAQHTELRPPLKMDRAQELSCCSLTSSFLPNTNKDHRSLLHVEEVEVDRLVLGSVALGEAPRSEAMAAAVLCSRPEGRAIPCRYHRAGMYSTWTCTSLLCCRRRLSERTVRACCQSVLLVRGYTYHSVLSEGTVRARAS